MEFKDTGFISFPPNIGLVEWKQYRDRLIEKLKPRFMSLSEETLVAISDAWDELSKAPATTDLEIMTNMMLISVDFYLFRGLDTFLSAFRFLIPLAVSRNETITGIAFETLHFVCEYSKEATVIYKDVFTKLETDIRTDIDSKYWSLALIILSKAKVDAKTLFSQFMTNYWMRLVEIATAMPPDIRESTLQIMECHVSELDDMENAHIRDQMFKSFKNKETDDMFIDIELRLYVSTLMGMKEHLRNTNWSLMYERFAKDDVLVDITRDSLLKTVTYLDPNPQIDFNKWLKQVITKPSELVDAFVKKWKCKMDMNVVLDYIYGCNECGNYCVFKTLKMILCEFPDIRVDAPKIAMKTRCCSHLVECFLEREELFSEEHSTYFNKILLDMDLSHPQYLVDGMKLLVKYPSKFDKMQIIEKGLKTLGKSFGSVKMQFVKVLGVIDDIDYRNEILLKLALREPDKRVRLQTVEMLTINTKISFNPMILQLINDSSFAVRRAMLKHLHTAAKYNSLLVQSAIYDMLDHVFKSIMVAPDTAYAIKCAYLMYSQAEYCSESDDFAKTCGRQILSVCIELLSVEFMDEALPVESPTSSQSETPVSGSLVSSFVSTTSYDDVQDARSFGNDGFQVDERVLRHPKMNRSVQKLSINKNESPRQAKIYQLCTADNVEKRNSYLIRCLSKLGKLCEPVMDKILKIFHYHLEMNTNDEYLVVVVRALTELAVRAHHGMNIQMRYPEMVQVVYDILSTTKNTTLSVEIWKLIGCAFDTLEDANSDIYDNVQDIEFKIGQYTRFVLSTILKHMDDINIKTLKVITMVVDCDPANSAEFTPKIIQLFVRALQNSTSSLRPTVFRYLITVTRCLKQEVAPLLPDICPFVKKHIDDEECMRLCASLSLQYRSEFAQTANDLFGGVLAQLYRAEYSYFRYAIKFVVFSVIQQNQSLDLLLSHLETLDLQTRYVQKVVKVMIMLIQNFDVRVYSARIAMYARTLTVDVTELIHSLIVYQDFDLVSASYLFQNMDMTSVVEYLQRPMRRPKDATFISRVPLVFKDRRMTVEYIHRAEFFKDYQYPQEIKMKKWVKELVYDVVQNSPIDAIRSCTEFIGFKSVIIRKIGSVAFLAAWKDTTYEDRVRFSVIVNKIIHEHSSLDNFLLNVFQLLERHFIPFIDIDYAKMAEIVPSNVVAFFLLQRRHMDGDETVLPTLMETVLKMNRSDTLRAYYNRCCSKDPCLISDDKRARYSGFLGDWEKALSIFKENKAPLSSIVECLEHLKKYDDIMDLEPELRRLPDGEEKNTALTSFLWAFLKYRENTKIENAMKVLNDMNLSTTKVNFFVILYLISIQEYDKAQERLDEAWTSLAVDQTPYARTDQHRLQQEMEYAKLFHELQRVIILKKSGTAPSDEIMSNWEHNIKYFKRDETAWERLIILRNMVIPIRNNLSAYKNIIVELRRNGYINLIDEYFGKQFDLSAVGSVIIERVKTSWARGDRKVCLDTCKTGVCLWMASTEEEYVNTMCTQELLYPFFIYNQYTQQPAFSSEMRDYTAQFFDCTSLDNASAILQTLSREQQKDFFVSLQKQFPRQAFQCYSTLMMCGIYNADYIYGMQYLYAKFMCQLNYNSYNVFRLAAKYYKCALEYRPDAYRAWVGWAFANLRMYMIFKDDPENCVISDDINDVGDVFSPSDDEKEVDSELNEDSWSLQSERRESPGDYLTTTDWDSTSVYNYGMSSSLPVGLDNIEPPIQDSRWDKIAKANRLKRSKVFKIEDNIDSFAMNAITGYLKSIDLRPQKALEHLCQMFSVLFVLRNSDSLSDEIVSQIINLPARFILQMIPQITVHLSHPDEKIRNIVHSLLENASVGNFEKVFFPLNLYARDGSQEAAELLKKMIHNDEIMAQDADIFLDGMVRAASTWFETWKHALEAATHNESRKNAIIAAKFEEFNHPVCEMDMYFKSMYGYVIEECLGYFKTNTEESLQAMWAKFKDLYEHLRERVNRLCAILLPKISEPLAMKRGFRLAVPGEPSTTLVEYVEPVMEILGTQQHPRCAYIVSNTGKRVKYLLKGNEDLRLDERLMQFFSLVNSIMNSSRANLNVYISCYTIVPMTKSAGLIRWITGADTMHQMVIESRELRGTSAVAEKAVLSEVIDCDYTPLNALQRLEVFNELSLALPGRELFEFMWARSTSPSKWLRKIERFTTSTALMSMVGYIIGLGDRHPSNIMIQNETGNIIHIDFGESFESTMYRKAFPEKVPFRLTRLIVNALEGSVTDGLYEKMCCTVMHLLRRHRLTLIAQLAIFVQEPLDLGVITRSHKKIMDRITLKLEGKDLSEDRTTELTVEDQVHKLIDIASNPTNYVRHYPGWCPFW